ncbi:Proline iminopeptidase [Lachnellula occidentalis]|uniref:Proline iminopeptidase n=1 Tax=Lachnellula occidentalis TaxID=215460 RepID=A0A8H8UGR1_9HELO|nr:Proline iminopeptidase [Lachnellula occidentalis]
MASARLLNSKSHLIPGKLKVSELIFEVPKDYTNPERGTIQLFARSVIRQEKPATVPSEEDIRKKAQKPYFVYLQGGPGFGCPPPQNSWITNAILDRGYQMLYLDQRGTGLSTPISAATLALQGDTHRQADYLKLFRADSIVRDCEAVRKTLTAEYPIELKKWSVFGQSFGGFCILTYLSFYPQGLREAFTSGGLAPVGKTTDQVYKATFQKVIERNKAYYTVRCTLFGGSHYGNRHLWFEKWLLISRLQKYPEDVETVQSLCFHIKAKGGLALPSGGKLTVRGLLTLGRAFGAHGGLDVVHDLILRCNTDLAQFQFITRPTLSALESALTFDDNVIYAVLHEAIYCQGIASNWSAERVGRKLTQFQWLVGSPQSAAAVRDGPLYFSGEMIFPFLFDIFPELEKLAQVADIIANYTGWPDLYDESQLARNEVPLYSATYIDDMYVDYDLAQDTAKLVKNCKQFITNSMYHDAIRSKTDLVLKELFALRDDSID